jgi:hypothetical protein
LDGICIFNNTVDPTVVINGLWIYQNLFGPNYTSANTSLHGCTSSIAEYFLGPTVQCQNSYFVNNIFQSYATEIGWANGFVNANGSNVWVVNNTCVSIGTSAIGHNNVFITGTNAYCYNNVFSVGSGIAFGAVCSGTNAIISSSTNNFNVLTEYFGTLSADYNIFPPSTDGNNSFGIGLYPSMSQMSIWYPNGPALDSLQGWQSWNDNYFAWPAPIWNTSHCDPHSTTNTPVFVSGTYVPATNDTVARGHATNLTALGITNDYYGNLRPTTGPWVIGAFQTTNGAPALTNLAPPVHLQFVVPHAVNDAPPVLEPAASRLFASITPSQSERVCSLIPSDEITQPSHRI